MSIHNEDIASVFAEIADLLEIRGENPFRVRAYRNGAQEVRLLPMELAEMLAKGADLTRVPGIGVALAGKIEEMIDSGSCAALNKLKKQLPPDVTEILHLPGLGPKRVHALHYDLDIHTPEQLYRTAKSGRLRRLPGFGPKIEERIVSTLETHPSRKRRFARVTAVRYAEPLVSWLERAETVDTVVIGGSYRRRRATIGNLNILVATSDPKAATDRLAAYDEVDTIRYDGSTRSTATLKNGLQVELRVVDPESLGATLHYLTGSKTHRAAIRALARRQGLAVEEQGVFEGSKRVAGETEESIFHALGLPYIEPELREERGEIEAARNGLLPILVERSDLRGDLHCHTVATDGHGTLEEMVSAAREQGLEYLAITDHSKRLTMVHGLDSRHLLRQMDEIDRLNETLDGFRVLKGIEVDILEDGTLDLPNRVLGRLDLVVGAIHTRYNLTRAKQTRRILKAMDHPHFSILAHPTGRLIAAREPYDVDMARIVRHARDRGCYLELNSNPKRLDLVDSDCRMAREEGVLVSVDSDAHSTFDLANLRWGVGQARRGWLEAGDVLNTRPLKELLPLLHRTM